MICDLPGHSDYLVSQVTSDAPTEGLFDRLDEAIHMGCEIIQRV